MHPVPTVVLVSLLGLVGLSANPVLSSLAVRFAGVAPTLGVAMSVLACVGAAVGSWMAAVPMAITDRYCSSLIGRERCG